MENIGKEIAGFFGELYNVFRILKRKKRRDAFDDSLHITQLSKTVVNSGLGIDFLFVVMIHNGGKVLRPHDFKYRSIVGGYYNEFTLKNFRWENHRRVLIDFEYEGLIRRIKKYQSVDVKNDEFMEGGQIRIASDFEGIKYKRYYFIQDDKESLWVVVAGTTASNETMSSTWHKHTLNVAINNIKNIISKY